MTKIVSILAILFAFFSCENSQNSKSEDKQLVVDYAEWIPDLEVKLNEISGIMVYDGLFWGFNDSGGRNKIYGFNREGEIKKEIEFDGAKNRDWEAITQDDETIYVGDFGNNGGARDNLRIYKIKKKEIKDKKEQKLEAKKIAFTYKEQTRYGFLDKTTPFDCEAMFEFEGSLYVFTKDWKNRQTRVYQIPTKKGEYEVSAIDSFDVKMLVTGADISPDKSRVALLGYENYQSYMWLFSNFSENKFFSGDSKFVHLSNLGGSQTEGICFWGNDSVLVSTERTNMFKQQVFVLDLEKIRNGTHQDK